MPDDVFRSYQNLVEETFRLYLHSSLSQIKTVFKTSFKQKKWKRNSNKSFLDNTIWMKVHGWAERGCFVSECVRLRVRQRKCVCVFRVREGKSVCVFEG